MSDRRGRRIYCFDCPFETDDEEEARTHRGLQNHTTTHTIQPALKDHHPGLFGD
jgi:hypothetical protein